jgi:NitT/TauT family transport system permease protein
MGKKSMRGLKLQKSIRLNKIKKILFPTLSIFAAILIWEWMVTHLEIPPYILPLPSKILVTLTKKWSIIQTNTLVTLWEIFLGFSMAVLIGGLVAILIVHWPTFEVTLYPILVAFQTVPKIALAPLFVVWFGFGLLPKVVVTFLVAFFPVVVDTAVGLRSIDPQLLQVVRSMGGTRLQIFLKIRLPNALPSIFAGCKVAITFAVVGAIVGEFVGSDSGLGYLLLLAMLNLDTALVFASLGVLTMIGVLLYLIVEAIEKRSVSWHVSSRSGEVSKTL